MRGGEQGEVAGPCGSAQAKRDFRARETTWAKRAAGNANQFCAIKSEPAIQTRWHFRLPRLRHAMQPFAAAAARADALRAELAAEVAAMRSFSARAPSSVLYLSRQQRPVESAAPMAPADATASSLDDIFPRPRAVPPPPPQSPPENAELSAARAVLAELSPPRPSERPSERRCACACRDSVCYNDDGGVIAPDAPPPLAPPPPSPSPLPRSGLASSSLRSAAGSGNGLAAAQRPADTSAAPAARLPLALARARESLAALREELRKEAAAVEAESRAGGGLG